MHGNSLCQLLNQDELFNYYYYHLVQKYIKTGRTV